MQTCNRGNTSACKQSSDDLGHSLPAPRGSPAARRARWRRPTSARAYRSSPRRSSATRGECCGRRVRVRAEVHAAGRAALSPFRLAAGARAHAARVGDAGRGARGEGVHFWALGAQRARAPRPRRGDACVAEQKEVPSRRSQSYCCVARAAGVIPAAHARTSARSAIESGLRADPPAQARGVPLKVACAPISPRGAPLPAETSCGNVGKVCACLARRADLPPLP